MTCIFTISESLTYIFLSPISSAHPFMQGDGSGDGGLVCEDRCHF